MRPGHGSEHTGGGVGDNAVQRLLSKGPAGRSVLPLLSAARPGRGSRLVHKDQTDRGLASGKTHGLRTQRLRATALLIQSCSGEGGVTRKK